MSLRVLRTHIFPDATRNESPQHLNGAALTGRSVMQSNVRRMMQIAATLFLVLGLAIASWGAPPPPGFPWQVNDVVVCYSTGKCAVLRINGTSLQLLNQLSDGLTNAGTTAAA